MRYDDTNPEKEEEKYFTAIKDMVEWLGELESVELHFLISCERCCVCLAFVRLVSHQCYIITQATHLMPSRTRQTTSSSSMTLLWI